VAKAFGMIDLVRAGVASLVLAGLIAPAAVLAAPDEYPLRVPATWTIDTHAHEHFAEWTNGASTYKADFTASAQTPDDLFFTIDNRRMVEAEITETRRERSTRCSTAFNLTTTKYAPATDGMNVGEELDYLDRGTWYSITYKRPAGAPDAAIERLLHTACPAQIASAAAPAGWRDVSRGIWISWIEPNYLSSNASGRITLTAHDVARQSPNADDDALRGFVARITSTTTSCGIPLRVTEGTTTIGSAGSFSTLIAESQYENRRYTAVYEHRPGYEDRTVRAAVLTLCAKTPFLLERWGAPSHPAALPLATPRISISVKLPHSFFMTSVTDFIGIKPPQTYRTTEDYSEENGTRDTMRDTLGDRTSTRQTIEIGRDRYLIDGGKWIKDRIRFHRIGGAYPDAADWRGTMTQGPDESIDGTPVNVYHIREDGTRVDMWVGATDRYIRVYDLYSTNQYPNGSSHSLSRFSKFDEPVTILPPPKFIDATNCPTGDMPPLPLTTVQAVFPEHGPRLKAALDIVVTVRVDVEGRVIDAAVAKPSGYSDLDRAAIVAARSTTFTPGSFYCTPHVALGYYTVTFDPR
jgi:TonB family protein